MDRSKIIYSVLHGKEHPRLQDGPVRYTNPVLYDIMISLSIMKKIRWL